MTEYEILEQIAYDKGILVDRTILKKHDALSGLYIRFAPNQYMILINKYRTIATQTIVLLEEIAHHDKTVGTIYNQSSVVNRKAERQARFYAYQSLIPNIKNAFNTGCNTLWELSEQTDIPENALADIVNVCNTKGIYLHPAFMVD